MRSSAECWSGNTKECERHRCVCVAALERRVSLSTGSDSRQREAIDTYFAEAGNYERAHYGVRTLMSVREAVMHDLVAALPLSTGASVLDAGCGPGYFLRRLNDHRQLNKIGLDHSADMLRWARRNSADDPRTSFYAGSIESLPFPGESFDLVCSAGVVEYLDGDEAAIGEVARVLRPGGYAVLAITNARSPALAFTGLINQVKKSQALVSAIDWVSTRVWNHRFLARSFRIRYQLPEVFRSQLAAASLELVADRYFYYMPWPHPLDRMLPRVTSAIGTKMEWLSGTWLKALAEGYVAVCRKRA